MDAIIAALIGVVGMLISGGFLWLRSEIVLLRNRMDERFAEIDKRFVDFGKRFDGIEGSIRAQGEQIARLEGREEAVAGG